MKLVDAHLWLASELAKRGWRAWLDRGIVIEYLSLSCIRVFELPRLISFDFDFSRQIQGYRHSPSHVRAYSSADLCLNKFM